MGAIFNSGFLSRRDYMKIAHQFIDENYAIEIIYKMKNKSDSRNKYEPNFLIP